MRCRHGQCHRGSWCQRRRWDTTDAGISREAVPSPAVGCGRRSTSRAPGAPRCREPEAAGSTCRMFAARAALSWEIGSFGFCSRRNFSFWLCQAGNESAKEPATAPVAQINWEEPNDRNTPGNSARGQAGGRGLQAERGVLLERGWKRNRRGNRSRSKKGQGVRTWAGDRQRLGRGRE